MKLDPEDEHLRASLYIMTTTTGHQYAYVNSSKPVAAHRVVVSAPKGQDVDHINGDTLDNRRANLRCVSRAENLRNTDRVRGVSRFRGVVFDPRTRQWTARIRYLDKNLYLGRHNTEEAANTARLTKEKELYGISPRRAGAFAAAKITA